MKKVFKKLLISGAIAASVAAIAAGCANAAPSADFKRSDYDVKNGDRITVAAPDATYKLLGDVPDGVSLDKNGTFVIGEGVVDGTQVVIAAVVNGRVVSTAVCKISVEVAPPQISFGGMSDYVIDGDRVSATANGYGVEFSLKTPIDGIKIDPSSGRVSYTQIVEDGTPFTVVASSRGSTAEKSYIAAVGDLIVLRNTAEFAEYHVGRDVEYVVDYGDMSGSGAEFARIGVKGVSVGGITLTDEQYSYDSETYTVTIPQSVVSTLGMGENDVRVYTAKNAATGTLKVATYVRTAEDLAAINESAAALAGYYALVRDVDLSDYLQAQKEKGEKGGWYPIGQYRDVTDGTATAMAFRGTFDGLGHKVSGLWIDWIEDRNEEIDESGNVILAPDPGYFNAGLFGYITNDGVIRNLEVESAEGEKSYMCSYSGGLAGVNLGLIENCLANVTVAMEPDHRVAGGLVGRNEGTLKNCISLGTVIAGSRYGALCGTNQGKIIDCYALDIFDFDSLKDADKEQYADRANTLGLSGEVTGLGEATEASKVFTSLDEMISGVDCSAWSGWTVTAGELPQIIKQTVR